MGIGAIASFSFFVLGALLVLLAACVRSYMTTDVAPELPGIETALVQPAPDSPAPEPPASEPPAPGATQVAARVDDQHMY